jgi:hypothetical protein
MAEKAKTKTKVFPMTVDRPRFSTADILAVQAAIDRLKAEVFKLMPPAPVLLTRDEANLTTVRYTA